MGEAIEHIIIAAEHRKEEAKKRKASHMKTSPEMLDSNGIEYEVKNNGIHLIVRHNGKVADFWPSTGKFSVRGSGQYFRGVKMLIRVMRGDFTQEQLDSIARRHN